MIIEQIAEKIIPDSLIIEVNPQYTELFHCKLRFIQLAFENRKGEPIVTDRHVNYYGIQRYVSEFDNLIVGWTRAFWSPIPAYFSDSKSVTKAIKEIGKKNIIEIIRQGI